MSFFGGGTDMEDYLRENGGAVLSTTFDKYCYVNVRHLPRFLIILLSYLIPKQRELLMLTISKILQFERQ